MIVLALFDISLTVLEWFTGFFDSLPALSLPASLVLVVPVPFPGAVAGLNTFFPVAIAVTVALVTGKALQWLYSLIPFKMT